MKVSSLKENREFFNEINKINQSAWPKFLLHWDCTAWSNLFSIFADYQIILIKDENLLAYGYTIPLYWAGDLVDLPDDLKVLVESGVNSYEKGIKSNVLLALAAVVSPNHKGKGLSYEIVRAMKTLSRAKQIPTLIVPVRPTLKSKYPLIPIEKYAKWKTEEGLAFDPWLRVHDKLGGVIYKTAEESMIITAKIENWESWSKLKIHGSGDYIIEGALSPVEINCEQDKGIYYDPCIWVKYEQK